MVWVNRVGPFKNPQEYYFYFSLPFCPPEHHQSQAEGLGEAIQGYELTRANVDIHFRSMLLFGLFGLFGLLTTMMAIVGNLQPKVICEKTLTPQDAALFTKAVDERYWYQLFIGMPTTRMQPQKQRKSKIKNKSE
jgi:hypothetical protein